MQHVEPQSISPEPPFVSWGVAQTCNCRPILDAIASLIKEQRPDLALVLIDEELNPQT